MAFWSSSSSSLNVPTPSFRRGAQEISFQAPAVFSESTAVYPISQWTPSSIDPLFHLWSQEYPYASQANLYIGVPHSYPLAQQMLGPSPARHPSGDIAPLQPAGAAVTPEYDNSLTYQIKKQIEYYFCDDNLAKDWFLRTNMNDEGWVPITLIASFPRIKELTSDIPTILKSLTNSNTLQVQDTNVRRRDTWKKWPKIPTDLAQGFKTTRK